MKRALAIALVWLLEVDPASAAGSYTDQLTKDFFDNLIIPGLVQNCCNDADCKRTRADYLDGHWVAESRYLADHDHPGEWVTIPDNRITPRQSPFDTFAVICEGSGSSGDREVNPNTTLRSVPGNLPVYLYCFAPPPLGF